MDNIKYPCTSCGCCCKRIDKAISSFHSIGINVDFNYTWDENGKCENLTTNNKCGIYDTRPLICNIDKLFEFVKITKEQFYAMNIASCNLMMDEDGVEYSFRIK